MSRSSLDFLGARAVFLFFLFPLIFPEFFFLPLPFFPLSAQGVVDILIALVKPGVDEIVAIEITAAIIF